jgi:uncharacterized protein (TIGR02271 family)
VPQTREPAIKNSSAGCVHQMRIVRLLLKRRARGNGRAARRAKQILSVVLARGHSTCLDMHAYDRCRALFGAIDSEDPAVTTTPHIIEERVDSREPAVDTRSSRQEQTVVPVLKEELDLHTRRVEIDSGVRVAKKVQHREEIVDEPLTREEVDVERVAVNRRVEGPLAVFYEGDTMVVPILEEVLVVEKHLILKEEIRITRRKSEFRAPQRVTLRREVAAVERIEDAEPSVSPAGDGSSRERGSGESLLEQKRRQNEDLRRKLDPSAPRE